MSADKIKIGRGSCEFLAGIGDKVKVQIGWRSTRSVGVLESIHGGSNIGVRVPGHDKLILFMISTSFQRGGEGMVSEYDEAEEMRLLEVERIEGLQRDALRDFQRVVANRAHNLPADVLNALTAQMQREFPPTKVSP